ncbi:hypothetical protein FS837_000317 [Tulasnella sp. UAMH 9824]|nr:hypothetical protein FS837_000317 [Tulasnella sp. UAMH 9824]
MSAPPVMQPNPETCRPKRKHDTLTEPSQPLQHEDTEETHPSKKIDTGESKINKLSIRGSDVLVAFLEKRITITDIKFTEKTLRDGGTFADVVMAILNIESSGGQEEKRVAVKKFRFVNDGEMTEDKFLLLPLLSA